MVKDIIIADELHLLEHGVQKKFLKGWCYGRFKNKVGKWTADNINEVNNYLALCKLPCEIHRAVRGLDTLSFWK